MITGIKTTESRHWVKGSTPALTENTNTKASGGRSLLKELGKDKLEKQLTKVGMWPPGFRSPGAYS